MRHPFQNIRNRRKEIFITLLVLTLLMMFLMNFIGTPLTTPEAPLGIVSYEFAGSVSSAQSILDSWDHNAQLHAAFSLGLDYLFMVLYSSTIALACIWAGEVLDKNSWPLGKVSVPLAWGLWAAALLDAVENIALVVILFGVLVSPWPELAKWCAVVKFALIFMGMVYAFYGLVAHLTSRFFR
jgi:hypothetical protein